MYQLTNSQQCALAAREASTRQRFHASSRERPLYVRFTSEKVLCCYSLYLYQQHKSLDVCIIIITF